ncbi:MAG: AbrB/MazE/SpoVT family DNA-binding domain-containing protein [Oscillospiraceae bacterium]|nr:AbrB/MazE/SpoVT family DNA-binding domain-containing protein [Oscillospiraceae bacterium]
METRPGKVTASRAGGTAGNGSKTYKVSLPSAWVNEMGLGENGGRLILSFDGGTVTIRPELSIERYSESRLAQGHAVLEIRYYDGDTLCTLICADMTARDLQAENYTDRTVKTAFGKNRAPSWEDLEAFLEERCIPRQRAGLQRYLELLGLDGYEPLDIVRKTQGRMAEDDQWMEVRELG